MTKLILALSCAVWACCASAHADALAGQKSGAEILAASAPEDWRPLDPENTIYIELQSGRVVIALSPVLATRHVARFKALARGGFYDGLSFYRVIEGFVAQGGALFEVRGDAGALTPLKAEFETELPESAEIAELPDTDGYAPAVGFLGGLPVGYDPKTRAAWHPHCTGAVAFGREDARDSASSEFYITLQPQRYLDRNMSVVGRVIYGMEHVQALRRVEPAASPDGDLGDIIVSVKVAADLPEKDRTQIELLASDSAVLANYAAARRNRPEAFFYYRPDYLDICQMPYPARVIGADE